MMSQDEWLQACERQAQRRHGARTAFRRAGYTNAEAYDSALLAFPSPPAQEDALPFWQLPGGMVRMQRDVPFTVELGEVPGWRGRLNGWIALAPLVELSAAVQHFKGEVSTLMIGDKGDR